VKLISLFSAFFSLLNCKTADNTKVIKSEMMVKILVSKIIEMMTNTAEATERYLK